MKPLCTLLTIVAILCCNMVSNAQNGNRSNYLRYDEFMASHLSSALKLEERRKSRFEELYIEFLSDTKSARTTLSGPYDLSDLSRLSDEQIEDQILSTYALTIEVLEVKKRYYGKFKEILTPREIATMYELERVGRTIFATELKRRKIERNTNKR